jgi:hypothetical protein
MPTLVKVISYTDSKLGINLLQMKNKIKQNLFQLMSQASLEASQILQIINKNEQE